MNVSWLLLLGAGLCCWGPPETWDFDSTTLNELPPGCCVHAMNDTTAGDWRVVDVDGNKVLAQLDRTRESERITLAVLDDTLSRNVRLSARIRVLAGDVEQSGGIVWRLEDSDNYLLARLDVQDKRVCLYRVCHGHRIMFGKAKNLAVSPGEWYALRVEQNDEVIKVYLDDEIQFIRRDRHIQEAGKVGMWVKGDSLVHFDEFRLYRRDPDKDCLPGESESENLSAR
jgi:hypothetical protein